MTHPRPGSQRAITLVEDASVTAGLVSESLSDGAAKDCGSGLADKAFNATNANEAFSFHPTGMMVVMVEGSARVSNVDRYRTTFAHLLTKQRRENASVP